MNISEMFDIQESLDKRILKHHPELKQEDNLDWKCLALQVELGECANEWRGFKKWSNNQKPSPKLLEEYADCLHLALSIGIEIGEEPTKLQVLQYSDVNTHFVYLITNVGLLFQGAYSYTQLLGEVLGLGELLGFTWGEIGDAYIQKNKINHERQASNY